MVRRCKLRKICYRFSAFWLRSKCSVCSYQLNIWYSPHRGLQYINLIFGVRRRQRGLLQSLHGSSLHCSTADFGSPFLKSNIVTLYPNTTAYWLKWTETVSYWVNMSIAVVTIFLWTLRDGREIWIQVAEEWLWPQEILQRTNHLPPHLLQEILYGKP